MRINHLMFLIFCLFFVDLAVASTLTSAEQNKIYAHLQQLPITRNQIWEILFPPSGETVLNSELQEELENILKISLVYTDTKITKLTPQLRQELDLASNIAAFHKQGIIPFEIVPSRYGSTNENKTNDTVRALKNDTYFVHEHNVFVDDAEISRDLNTVILLFHELSHAAFDKMLEQNPQQFVAEVSKVLPKKEIKELMKIIDGQLKIDGDLYDLFSERYAFELEYRLDQTLSSSLKNWPTFYRFDGVSEEEYLDLINGFVRRVYNIDHPTLENASAQSLSDLLKL